MKRLTLLCVVIAISLGHGAAAQARPDFSGTWLAPDSTLKISHVGTRLTVTDLWDTRVYNLDGTDSRVETPDRSSTSPLTAQARWVESALVITTTTDGRWQDLKVYSLDYGPKLSVVHVSSQTTVGMMSTKTTTYTKR